MQTENILSWLNNIGFTELSTAVQILIAIVATFISEDATLLGLALLKQAQAIDSIVFWLGGFAGIIIGDMILYFTGRYIASGRDKFLWLNLQPLREKANTHEKSIFIALMLSQFLPGSRFLSYISAGISQYPVFLFFLSKALILPLWLFLFSILGNVLLVFLQNNAWLALGLLLLVILIYAKARRFNRQLAHINLTMRLKTFFYGFKRYRYFEFWPAVLFYWPVVFYIIFFTLKYKRGALPAASNPGIEYGGWVGEDKSLICDLIPATHAAYLHYAVITAKTENKLNVLHELLNTLPITYPFILKPEKGLRGAGVRLITCAAEAKAYLQDADFDVLLQEYCDYQHEAGIFYVRYPGASSSEIFSITDKKFPYVIGDGISTLAELILQDKRAQMIAQVYFDRFGAQLNTVPIKGESIRLAESGNHAQGVAFLNGMDTLYSPELHQAFDELANKIEGFYIGRFDVRYKSIDDFRQGKHFKIIEINGAGAEATHIYDPNTRLVDAYSVLFTQFSMLYEIGAINAKNGIAVPSNTELLRVWWRYLQLSKQYVAAS